MAHVKHVEKRSVKTGSVFVPLHPGLTADICSNGAVLPVIVTLRIFGSESGGPISEMSTSYGTEPFSGVGRARTRPYWRYGYVHLTLIFLSSVRKYPNSKPKTIDRTVQCHKGSHFTSTRPLRPHPRPSLPSLLPIVETGRLTWLVLEKHRGNDSRSERQRTPRSARCLD